MAAATIMFADEDSVTKSKLFSRLQREEGLMGDVKHNTHPKAMYDLNLFQVPLFLSKCGFVYSLENLLHYELKSNDQLKSVVLQQMQELAKRFDQ